MVVVEFEQLQGTWLYDVVTSFDTLLCNCSQWFCCFVQLGGTIGDIEGMPFVEAFRQFQFRVGTENFTNIHVSLVPQVSHVTFDCYDNSR